MTSESPPPKRPLVLLHKCPECTTFALAPLAAIRNLPQRNAASVQQRLSRLRLSSAPATISENVGFSVDDGSVFDEEDESEMDHRSEYEHCPQITAMPTDDGGSSTSGHSSLEDSPVVQTESLSWADRVTKVLEVADNDLAAGRMSKALRHRSVSECEGVSRSPVKGILKCTTIVRSLSECANEGTMEGVISECLYPSGIYVSESGDDDGDFGQHSAGSAQSPSFKKTVRFNDSVQQTLFRPNSSILGQKKRSERKQKHAELKRKRSGSNSSAGSGSRVDVGETETESNSSWADLVRHHQNKALLVEGDSRYAGFLIGRQSVDHSKLHRRQLSGDSALGDDEGDLETGESSQSTECFSARKVRKADMKDSGVDEEL